MLQCHFRMLESHYSAIQLNHKINTFYSWDSLQQNNRQQYLLLSFFSLFSSSWLLCNSAVSLMNHLMKFAWPKLKLAVSVWVRWILNTYIVHAVKLFVFAGKRWAVFNLKFYCYYYSVNSHLNVAAFIPLSLPLDALLFWTIVESKFSRYARWYSSSVKVWCRIVCKSMRAKVMHLHCSNLNNSCGQKC